tara:strand:+ start:401 stop:1678 length:1278 start_codon:yes stop_codon:yes gene_type:complete
MDKWKGIEKEIKTFFYSLKFGDYRIMSRTFKDFFTYSKNPKLYLHMKDILHLLTEENLKTVDIKDIDWKTKNLSDSKKGKNCICCGGERYKKCDTKFPSVIVDDMQNPSKLRYRLIDGKHRMQKRLDSGMKKSLCYVLQWEEIKKYLKVKNSDGNHSFIKYNSEGKMDDKQLNYDRGLGSVVYIFDVDGTLTPSRLPMTKQFKKFFSVWLGTHPFYLVTGSDLPKLQEQMCGLEKLSNGIFTCCGNQYFKPTENDFNSIYDNKFKLSKKLKSTLEIILASNPYPHRFGNHIEDRGSMVNFSIVGRDCTQEQREDFFKWDNEKNERKKISTFLKHKFKDLDAVLGGQISIDIYPKGNDKSQVLQHIEQDFSIPFYNQPSFVFIGDRTKEGGNDYPLAKLMEKTNNCKYYHTENWKQTQKILESIID